MKKVFITYAEGLFVKNKLFALKMAELRGGFDSTIGYSREDIDAEFYQNNHRILNIKKGAGYWLWKPYFIYKALNELNNGDLLFYSDAGSFFCRDINVIYNELALYNQDIMAFELPLIELQWTKQELFNNMDCNQDSYKYSNQINSSFHFVVKSELSLKFYKEYLKVACNMLNISDDFEEGVNQHESFISHRYDQSIFSLLYKKYNFTGFKDPTQFGKYPQSYTECVDKNVLMDTLSISDSGRKFIYKNYKEAYKGVIFHNRLGNPLLRFSKYKVKEFLFLLNLYKGIIK